jgi:GTP-binding protein Era
MAFLYALPGAIAEGLIWGLMGIGVYISYKILDIADLTVDGSICTGACVCAVLLGRGVPVWLSVLCALLAGALAGVVTGLLHTALGIPSILAVNKTDLATPEEIAVCLKTYSERHDFDAFVPLCAKNGKNARALLSECEKFLIESEWLFPEDMMTDQPMRQVTAEIIREKVLRTLDKEIPHGVAVVIEEFKEEDDIVRIRAEIFCEKESHKGIIVGKGGVELKRIGSYARADLEKMLGTKVYLNLWVKVKENWRESQRGILDFGYTEE